MWAHWTQGFFSGSEVVGQVNTMCPLLQQQKQGPFLAHWSYYSRVSFRSLITSTSMALESLVALEKEEKDWKAWVALPLH